MVVTPTGVQWCHHGSILPLYGSGEVVYEYVFGGQYYIEGGRGG